MILYNNKQDEQVIYVRCECKTHGMEITKIKDIDEIFISMVMDKYYSEQDGFFVKLKSKLKKIWLVLIGKNYKLDYDIILSRKDLDELIQALQEIKGKGE